LVEPVNHVEEQQCCENVTDELNIVLVVEPMLTVVEIKTPDVFEYSTDND
jgi:hypothetical protein